MQQIRSEDWYITKCQRDNFNELDNFLIRVIIIEEAQVHQHYYPYTTGNITVIGNIT